MSSLTTPQAGGPIGNIGHHCKGRQAVYIVDTPTDWKPTSCWSFPPTILAGELYVKNVNEAGAFGFAQTFNQAALKSLYANRFNGRWALAARHLKNCHAGRHPDDWANVILCRDGSPYRIARSGLPKADARELVKAFNELSAGTGLSAAIETEGGAS